MRIISNVLGISADSLRAVRRVSSLLLCAAFIGLSVAAAAMAAPWSLDPTFGNAGKVIWNPNGGQSAVGGEVALLPGGKIIMIASYVGGGQHMIVARFNVRDMVPRSAWPLKRKLAWFALYIAMFVWAGMIILPHRV